MVVGKKTGSTVLVAGTTTGSEGDEPAEGTMHLEIGTALLRQVTAVTGRGSAGLDAQASLILVRTRLAHQRELTGIPWPAHVSSRTGTAWDIAGQTLAAQLACTPPAATADVEVLVEPPAAPAAPAAAAPSAAAAAAQPNIMGS